MVYISIKTLERQFTNKFGNSIKEDIIIAVKSPKLDESLCGRQIALRHLEQSLKTTQNGAHSDISEAISNHHEVKPSPLFNPKHIIVNESHTA